MGQAKSARQWGVRIEKIETLWYYDHTKVKLKAGGKIDSDGTDRPETSGRFTEIKRFSPA